MRKLIATLLMVIVLGTVSWYGYNWLNEVQASGDITIEKDGAKSLDVEIDFNAGDLLITGGSDEWMTGTIETNRKKYEPKLSYRKKGSVGHLDITQKAKGFIGWKNVKNDWNLQLTNEIPVTLDIDMGVSDSEIDLSDIRLKELSIDAGVSDTTINLSGDWQESFHADIDLGVGDVTILLPKDTGVKLNASKGIGSLSTKGFVSEGKGVYVNDAYDHSDVTITMDIDIGVGDVEIRLVD